MYRISIITVVRNDRTHIAATMRSVLEQTYTEIEYIVLDGASLDGTLEVIKEVAAEYHDRKVVVVSEPDKGVYDAMNKGIKMSHGSWINFMNSGDTFHSKTVLEDMMFDKVEQENSVLYADASVKYWDGTVIEKPKPFFTTPLKFKGIGICHQTMFFPGDVARTMQHNLKYKIAADYEFSMRLYKAGHPFVYRPVTVVDYTWGDGISSNPRGLIPVYRENAEVARQKWHPLYWAFILREYWRLWKRKHLR